LPNRGHQKIRLVALFIPVQGIDPGLFQSTVVSPIPSPSPAVKASRTAAIRLLRPR
jgi:hypothetical protein